MKKLLNIVVYFLISLSICLSDCYYYNLIKNGGFEDGYTDFYTQYIRQSASQGTSPNHYFIYSPQEQYGILDWTGKPYEGNNFLAVDGSTTSYNIIWSQTISIDTERKLYTFSCYVSSLTLGNYANLMVLFDGVKVINSFQAPTSLNTWSLMSSEWYSYGNSEVTISIIDLTTVYGANDFGIDDIQFYDNSYNSNGNSNDIAGTVILSIFNVILLYYSCYYYKKYNALVKQHKNQNFNGNLDGYVYTNAVSNPIIIQQTDFVELPKGSVGNYNVISTAIHDNQL